MKLSAFIILATIFVGLAKAQCPNFGKMDFVFALDSSTSTGAENWAKVQNLVTSLISHFSLAPEKARFSVFRFNRIPHRRSEIVLNSFIDDKPGMITAVYNLPYYGSGSYIGRALQHAKSVSLSESNGNRAEYKDIVVTVTDGRTYDDMLTPSNSLRDSNVLTYAIGVQPTNGRGTRNDKLLEIAGSEQNLFLTNVIGFNGAYDGIIAALERDLCV
uniref:VWFA domain-containing protein n=1 Tax=Ciona intestinalis TaxID=7719 RepID=H2XKK4_CIOIN